jgi:hypothetical protein
VLLGLLLAACSTPRERCIDGATERYRTVASLISELRQTIARGYALHRERVPYTRFDICFWSDPHTGHARPYSCPHTAWRTVTTPVAVDIAQERAKLAEYERLLPELRAEAAAGVAQCETVFPAEP